MHAVAADMESRTHNCSQRSNRFCHADRLRCLYWDGVRPTPMDIGSGQRFSCCTANRRALCLGCTFEPPPSLLSKMQEEFNLHELAIEDTNRGSQRPKLEEYGSTLFVVPHTVERHGNGSSTANCTSTAVSILCSRCGTVPRPAFGVRAELEREPAFLALDRAPRCMGLLTPSLIACFRGGCARRPTGLAGGHDFRRPHGPAGGGRIALYALKRDTMRAARGDAAGGGVRATAQPQASNFRDALRPYFRTCSTTSPGSTSRLDNLRDMENSATQTNLSLITWLKAKSPRSWRDGGGIDGAEYRRKPSTA